MVTVLAWLLAVVALGLGGLALAAPESLVTDVALGAPFVPFAGDSRVLTPIGLVSVGLLVVLAAVTAPRWWPVLRRSDLFGAVLVAIALGCLVLTFASSDPEREVVGLLGYSLLPVGAVALARVLVVAPSGQGSAHPAWRAACPRGAGSRRQPARRGGPRRGRRRRAPLARLTEDYDATGAALVLVRFLLAVPVGALLGGWALRHVGDGGVAGFGLALAGAGLLAMSRWTLESVGEAAATTIVLVPRGSRRRARARARQQRGARRLTV